MSRAALLLRALLSIAVLCCGGLFAGAAPASGTVTTLCTGYAACAKEGMASSGYAGASSTMWWRMYAGHNCTNYAAYRLVQSGLPNVRPWDGSGNATNWGTAMSSITDGTPAVGAIAWWKANVSPAGSAGHVAYVERVVSADEIIVSQDSWGGDFSWARITRASKGWPSGFIHFNDVPLANEARPTVEGTARVGSILSAEPGSWKPGDVTFAYQWRADGEDIAGADDPSLKLTQALEGTRIRVRVTASKLGYPTTSVVSGPTAAVQPGVLRNTVAPGIVGLPVVDETLTVSAGAWTPSPGSVSYHWLADGTPIKGASGQELAVTPALVGASISVAATAVKAGYDPVTATSVATAPVALGTLAAPTSLAVEGVARPGEVLTVTVPQVTPAAAPTITWLRRGKPVAGATGPSYEITSADLGARLEARVEWSRPGYAPAIALSDPTPVVRTTPVLRIGADPGRRTLSVRAAVRSSDLDPVEGVVRIRSHGELLGEVRLTDGYATTKVKELPPGTWTFRFRFPTTREALGATVTRRITIG